MTDANPNSLRLEPELSAIGVSDEVIDALGARTDTDVFGMQALRRGIIDAAHAWQQSPAEIDTPEEVRAAPEYSIGFDANTTVLFKKTDRGMAA